MWCKGANVTQRELVTSDMGIKNNSGNIVVGNQVNSFLGGQNRAWELLRDLGINILQIATDIGVNNLYVNVDESTYWEQNLSAVLNKAASYDLKVTFHWMGYDGTGGTLGLDAPFVNNSARSTYLTISQGEALLDKLGGANDLSKNFLADSRVAWWPVINEAPIDTPSYDYVFNWVKAMCNRIHNYGGKTSAVVRIGWYGYPHPDGDFGDVVTRLPPSYMDYIQGHHYAHDVVRTHASDGAENFYDALYDEYVRIFQGMINSREGYSIDQIINSECCMGNGTWYGDVEGHGAMTTTQCQQAQYIKALEDAAKKTGIGGFCWHSPIQPYSTRQYGFIEYNGTINNTACSPTPPSPCSPYGPYSSYKVITETPPPPEAELPFRDDFDVDLSNWTVINGTWSLV